ncbi:hypothetical protein HZB60_05925 [candidate division KSB1 bacterium]|nr:hypothetical protein [candidate division KSB1 bacterium]
MFRFLGTGVVVALLCLSLQSGPALAYDSPQKYGVELRGGFGVYDMGDVTAGADYLKRQRVGNSLTEGSGGGVAGLSGIFRPSKQVAWEVGYNALMDVENLVESTIPDSQGQILTHSNEFFLKGSVITYLTNSIQLGLGAGIAYYNTELQIQDDFNKRYNYDADGRGFGVIGGLNLEFLLSQHVALNLAGGGRLANASDFSQESSPGVRTGLNVLGGTRPMEVNLSGGYASLGLRFYFSKTTQPVDFGR